MATRGRAERAASGDRKAIAKKQPTASARSKASKKQSLAGKRSKAAQKQTSAAKRSRGANGETVSKRPRRAKGAKAKAKTFFVHPQALVESDRIGPRTRVWAFAHILDGAVLGADCNICDGVFVEGGVTLGDHVTVKNGVQLWTGVRCEDYVFIGPNATFTNDLRPRVANPLDPADFAVTHVGRGASIGANATIVAGNPIGHDAMIGAGAVVVREVPAHALVVGNPARQIGWVCSCGQRLGDGLSCGACGTSYRATASGLKPQ